MHGAILGRSVPRKPDSTFIGENGGRDWDRTSFSACARRLRPVHNCAYLLLSHCFVLLKS